tara:strand:- start:6487 stop:7431 length:945 start_codon:yes stop_codon:yes gene_type:complete
MTFKERIKNKAYSLGFTQVGISRVESDGEAEDQFRAWLSRGFHGEMHWMERTASKRGDIKNVLPDVQSVVSVAVNYYTNNTPQETKGKGRISRYAWGDDYHYVITNWVRQLATWISAEAKKEGVQCESLAYVDTGPILEKAWAQRAGIGWIGKHSNLVSADYGSWLLLGEVLLTINLEPDIPARDQCGACRLCIEICPTDAIPEPYVLDATKCISYLTIEHRGPIPDLYHSNIGNRIFGCDDCLDICPYNEHATPTSERAFAPRAYALSPDLKKLAHQTLSEFQATFKKSALKRTKHEGLQRNVEIARKNASQE